MGKVAGGRGSENMQLYLHSPISLNGKGKKVKVKVKFP
jgi:hypothetical protein